MAALAQSYNLCEDGFAALKNSLTHGEDALRARTLDQYERFQIWAGNIGARQQPQVKISLDWRVREAPKLRHQIGELLEDLASTIEELTSITSGERPNRVSTPVSEQDGSEPATGGLSEIDELVEMLSESIAGLFKITLLIQKATPRDRFSKAQSSAKEPIDPFWDILHVSHKFPRLAAKDTQWLQRKFGTANAQRRQFFRYTREHRERKAAIGKQSSLVVPEHKELQIQPSGEYDVQPFETRTLLSIQKPASSFAQTTASTLAVAKLPTTEQDSEDDAVSHTSFATSVNESNDAHRLRVPKLQDISQGQSEFECPYCYTIVKPRSHNQWKMRRPSAFPVAAIAARKHVFEDLKPYICTFKGCDTKLFSDRRAWFDHEVDYHRVIYRCRFCPHRAFDTKAEIEDHLNVKHKDLCTSDTLPSILQACQEKQDSFDASSCPCCTEWEKDLRQLNSHIHAEVSIYVTSKQFRNHLASHQEQLALFTLPKHYSDDKDDFESAEVAAGDSSASLTNPSLPSLEPIDEEISDKSDKLFRKLEHLLVDDQSSDNYTLQTVVNQLLIDAENVDKVFRLVLSAEHPLQLDLVKLTLDSGANPNQEDADGQSPLYIAAKRMSLDLMRIILASGAKITAEFEWRLNALHLIIEMGWIDGFAMLLEWNLDINDPLDWQGNRAIHIATGNSDLVFVKYLLDAGANSSIRNFAGRTVLHVIPTLRNMDVIDFAFLRSSIIDVPDTKGQTALHYAVLKGQVDTVEILLVHGANPNTVDNEHYCPLLSAAEEGAVQSPNCEAIVRHLLDHGASIQLWRARIHQRVLLMRIEDLVRLQQIFEKLEGPVTAEIQDYIDEARQLSNTTQDKSPNVESLQGSDVRLKAVEPSTAPSSYIPKETFPDPTSNYWPETEASQLEYLAIRSSKHGQNAIFMDSLEDLGALYQDWLKAHKQIVDSTTLSELSTSRDQLSRKLIEVSIDLWVLSYRESAQELMIDVIKNSLGSKPDSYVLLQYNIITAIAAAMGMQQFRSSPWRPTLREDDRKAAIRYRDSTTRYGEGSSAVKCPKCSEIVFRNETVYALHWTWHEYEREYLASKPSAPVDLQQTSQPKPEAEVSPMFSGPMIYGVLKYKFQAERPDELSVMEGESVMILAMVDDEWIVVRSISRPDIFLKPGMVPISFVHILQMSSGYPVDDSKSALEAACLPSLQAWKTFDSLLQFRRSSRLSTVGITPAIGVMRLTLKVQFDIPVRASISYVVISNDHDMYYINCENQAGAHYTVSRFYMEFYELQTTLLQGFPEDAEADGQGKRNLPYLRGPALSEKRTATLNTYLRELFALPTTISRCDAVKKFFTPGPGDDAQASSTGNETEQTTHEDDTLARHAESDVIATASMLQTSPTLTSGPTSYTSGPIQASSIKASKLAPRYAIYDVLLTGFPRFNVKLNAKAGKLLIDWLVHVFALELGSEMEHATRALLTQLNIECSNHENFCQWFTRVMHSHLDIRHVESSSTYTCASCGREPANVWENQARYNLEQYKSTVKLCIACIVSMSFLDVKHTARHQAFGEWLIPEILNLGATVIKTVSGSSSSDKNDQNQIVRQRKSMTVFGLDLLDAIAFLWRSRAGEEQVAKWIWSVILLEPNSYIMSRREMDLIEQCGPTDLSRHNRSIMRAAVVRYEESRSSQDLGPPLGTIASCERSLDVPVSFLFTAIDVEADNSVQSRQTWRKQWLPPNTCDGIKPSITEQATGRIYRWVDGAVSPIEDCNPEDYNLSTSVNDVYTYSTYTVIMDESKAFACVPFDARRVEVRSSGVGEWQYLGFNHVYDKEGKNVLSKAAAPGEFPRLAGYKEDEASSWIRDLIPGEYRSAAIRSKDKTPVRHDGLVGSLALILALAAFTAPVYDLDDVMQRCFRPGGRWVSRGEVSHARMRRRGIIITIWQDVSTPNACSRDTIRQLEAGAFGPILRCDHPIPEESTDQPSQQRKSKVDVNGIIGKDSTDRFAREGASKDRSRFSIAPSSSRSATSPSRASRQPVKDTQPSSERILSSGNEPKSKAQASATPTKSLFSKLSSMLPSLSGSLDSGASSSSRSNPRVQPLQSRLETGGRRQSYEDDPARSSDAEAEELATKLRTSRQDESD